MAGQVEAHTFVQAISSAIRVTEPYYHSDGMCLSGKYLSWYASPEVRSCSG